VKLRIPLFLDATSRHCAIGSRRLEVIKKRSLHYITLPGKVGNR